MITFLILRRLLNDLVVVINNYFHNWLVRIKFFFFCVFSIYNMSPHPLVFSSLFQVTYVVLSVCVAVLCELKFGQVEVCESILGNVEGDSAILFGKVCLWVLELLFTAYVQQQHSKARSRGYLQFYREMQGLKYLQLNIHSAGTAANHLATSS